MRTQISAWIAFGCWLAVLGAAPSASAVEPLDGTYEVKLSCSGLAGAAKDKYKLETELSITQPNPEDVRFLIEGVGQGAGYVLAEMAKPGSGTISGVSCGLDASTFSGLSLQTVVKTKPGSEAASFSGTLHLYDRTSGEAHVCKIKAKRVSVTPPNLPECT